MKTVKFPRLGPRQWAEVLSVLKVQDEDQAFLARVEQARATGCVAPRDLSRMRRQLQATLHLLEDAEWKPVPESDPLMSGFRKLGAARAGTPTSGAASAAARSGA